MNTPIVDFAKNYAGSNARRLHMPGHKGRALLGCEPWDLTEIDGADDLSAPNGIIAESEANASRLFGAQTLYSCEGSSLCIRAMLYLAVAARKNGGERPLVIAARNAHKVLIYALAMLDADVAWIAPDPGDSLNSCRVTPQKLERTLNRAGGRACAVYLTSPDYLGNLADIRSIAAVCRAQGVPLLVDCAHGAYLRFLPEPLDPIGLGADLCCDSAHKTLPALTGAAYLHLSDRAPEVFHRRARQAMALFASTSPSWLILESLDACNAWLETAPERLRAFLPQVDALRARLRAQGWTLAGDEPMKVTIDAAASGWSGDELARKLTEAGVIPEFHDPDYVVLMPSPMNAPEDLSAVSTALGSIGTRKSARVRPAFAGLPEAVLSPREAILADWEELAADQCEGRVLADAPVSCPPAIPIVMPGERIDKYALERFRYYGIDRCRVIR